MEIKGKFFAVGHGLTYAFKIDSFHVLFDIRKNCDFDELEHFYGNRNIDILVISHFDIDHSDGIQGLYDQGFKIKQIYIPYIEDDEELLLQIMFLYYDRNYAIEREALGDTVITEVRELEIYIYDFWKFNIYNSKGNSSNHIDKIIQNLNSIGIKTKDDLRHNLSTKKDDIKKAYKNVIKNLNLTSMFMEHGPVGTTSIKESSYAGFEFLSRQVKSKKNDHMHSLITGDCNLLKNKNEINCYLNELGYVLVPHHSGTNEWNDYICKNTDNVIWIVTISEIKTRPYALVVNDIYSNSEELYICDKIRAFEYEFTTV